MKPSQKAVDLIKQFEGFRANAYLCPANVPTIGYGSTSWGNGQKVKMGEIVSMTTAEKLLMVDLEKRSKALEGLKVNQNQFDALISFVYNLGVGAFKGSTLFRKVQQNPEDVTIRHEFMKWNKARVGGKLVELKGLTRRRDAEANLYYAEN
jgi:lysozyme